MSKPLRLLLVEDSEDDALALIRELERGGYDLNAQRVDTLEGVEAALKGRTWDIVISDYSIPRFSGLDALKLVRKADPDLPFIIVSARIGEETAASAMKAGAQDYFRKDNLARLAPAVERELNEARVRRERKQAEESFRHEAARTEALLRIGARLNARLDLDAVLTAVCEEAARGLKAPAAGVALYEDADDALHLVAAYGLPPEYREHWTPLSLRTYLSYAQRMGPLVVIPDTRRQADLPNTELYATYGIRTLAAARLARGEQLIGTLNVYSFGEVRDFNEEELSLLGGIADQSTQAIANARLYARNLSQMENLHAFYVSTQKLSQNLNLQEVVEDICRTSVEVFGASLAWVGRAQPDGGVGMLAHYPAEMVYPSQTVVRWDDSPEGQGPTGRAIRGGFPTVIPDIASDPTFQPWREQALGAGFCCAAAFPLIARDKPFGGLMVYSDKPDFFIPERIQTLRVHANQAAAALENSRLFEETTRSLKRLQALRSIDLAIAGSLDLQVTLNLFLEQLMAVLGTDAACVLLLNPHSSALEFAAGRGFRTAALQHTRLPLGEGFAGLAALERRIVSVPDLGEAQNGLRRAPLLDAEKFVSYIAAPLLAKGKVKGVLEVFHCTHLAPDQDWLDFLEALGGQAAIAIDDAELFTDLQRSNLELTVAYDSTLEGWVKALDLRDKETEGHALRVTEMTVRLARAMGLGESEMVHVRRGALLHDIGKIAISDTVLLKPGPLTEEEWEVMRKHPIYAHELLSPIPYLRQALDIPYCHHEKWDGGGYPRGLKGEEIPLAARLFAVVDVWDALCSDRPYRPAWRKEKVRERVRSQAGAHFDPKAVETFLNLMESPGQELSAASSGLVNLRQNSQRSSEGSVLD